MTVGSTQNPPARSPSLTWTLPPVANVPPSSSASRRYASTRSRWTFEMTGPQIAEGSAGSAVPIAAMVSAADCTASSYFSRGTTSRVVSAHPCPAWMHTVKAVPAAAAATSVSSSTIEADLPPSSRKTFFRVGAAAAMIARPVSVDPVNETMSTRGSEVSWEATSLERGITTLSTPAGMSVRSATRRPSSAATQGVSGAGLSTTVQPAARAGPILARLIWVGTFHGEIAATTPTGSRRTVRRVGMPIGCASPRSVSNS